MNEKTSRQQVIIEEGMCPSLPHYYSHTSASVFSQREYDEKASNC